MFVNLGIKTDYSLLKSLVKFEDLFSYAKNNNIKTLGILDDNLCSSHLFVEYCNRFGIKPIIGLDIYVEKINMYLYPTNVEGLTNLFKFTNGEITLDRLKEYKDNLIVVLPYKSSNEYGKVFPIFDDVYLSYSNEGELYSEKNITDKLIYIKKVKALDEDSSKYLNYLYMIENNLKLGEVELKDFTKNVITEEKYDCSEFVNKIDIKFTKKHNHIPKFNPDINSEEYLKDLAIKGLTKRMNGEVPDEYKNRLKYELDIITKMGYVDYFLIVFDYVRYALKNNIMVGCGRGSAVGSLVSYSLGITWIDPIKYNLLFERFLNPERVTLPDIDIDFDSERRDEVVDYVIDKYGKNRVSHIMTYGTMTAKEVIRVVGKINSLEDGAIDSLSRLLDPKKKLKDNLTDDVKNLLKRNSSLRKVFDEALYLEGIKHHIGTHAAGIVISDEDLTNTIPIITSGDVQLSGYQMGELESLGLLKMDFLSVSNLTVIKDVLDLIEEETGEKININNIPLDEKKVYDLLSTGNTNGIFQFDTPLMKNYFRKAKASEFKDLVMALSINRPGPMANIPEYLARKNEGKKIDYILPELEPILKETYGIMIYQEQVMEVLRTLAGYSFGEADVIRRAISKKKLDVIKNERIRFIESSVKRGFDKDKIEKIYDLIVEFADYGFNKSHSVAYSLIAYQMAYLKVNYPGYFYLVNLNLGGRKDRIINEAKTSGIKICKPDINISSDKYVFKDNSIILSFRSIKGITDSISKTIVEARGEEPFKDVYDFFGRVKNINKKILTVLIEAGVFDSFNINRASLIKNLDSLITYGELIQTLSKDLVSEPELKIIDEFSDIELMNKELDLYGFYVSNHPCSKFDSVKQIDIKKYFDKNINMTILVKRISKIKTKKNDDMAFLTYEDETGIGEAVVFSEVFNQLEDITENDLVKLSGRVERRMDKFQLVVKKIEKVS